MAVLDWRISATDIAEAGLDVGRTATDAERARLIAELDILRVDRVVLDGTRQGYRTRRLPTAKARIGEGRDCASPRRGLSIPCRKGSTSRFPSTSSPKQQYKLHSRRRSRRSCRVRSGMIEPILQRHPRHRRGRLPGDRRRSRSLSPGGWRRPRYQRGRACGRRRQPSLRKAASACPQQARRAEGLTRARREIRGNAMGCTVRGATGHVRLDALSCPANNAFQCLDCGCKTDCHGS